MKRFFQRHWHMLVLFNVLVLACALAAFTLPVEPAGQISVSQTQTGPVVQLSKVLIGEQGHRIRQIRTGGANIDPPSIAATTRGTATFSLLGCTYEDGLVMIVPAGINDDLLYVGARCDADNGKVFLYNPTAGAIDDGSVAWRYIWIDMEIP